MTIEMITIYLNQLYEDRWFYYAYGCWRSESLGRYNGMLKEDMVRALIRETVGD